MIEIVGWSRDGKLKKNGEPSETYRVRYNGREMTMPLADLAKFVQYAIPEAKRDPLLDRVNGA